MKYSHKIFTVPCSPLQHKSTPDLFSIKLTDLFQTWQYGNIHMNSSSVRLISEVMIHHKHVLPYQEYDLRYLIVYIQMTRWRMAKCHSPNTSWNGMSQYYNIQFLVHIACIFLREKESTVLGAQCFDHHVLHSNMTYLHTYKQPLHIGHTFYGIITGISVILICHST
jgi:hypothetical protein